MKSTLFPTYNLCPEAMKYFEMGYKCQMEGELELAETYYKKSLEIEDTAEGHTYLGWNYSFMEKLEEAIEECKRAIELDPDFGNPYNDIGSYSLQLGKLDDAVDWLQKAKEAERYDNPEYPYLNLGKVYELRGLWPLAVKEYEGALSIKPDFEAAKNSLEKLKANLN